MTSIPFAGRKKEIATILQFLSSPEPGMIVIVGESGSGRTRLMEECTTRIKAQNSRFLHAKEVVSTPNQRLPETLTNLTDQLVQLTPRHAILRKVGVWPGEYGFALMNVIMMAIEQWVPFSGLVTEPIEAHLSAKTTDGRKWTARLTKVCQLLLEDEKADRIALMIDHTFDAGQSFDPDWILLLQALPAQTKLVTTLDPKSNLLKRIADQRLANVIFIPTDGRSLTLLNELEVEQLIGDFLLLVRQEGPSSLASLTPGQLKHYLQLLHGQPGGIAIALDRLSDAEDPHALAAHPVDKDILIREQRKLVADNHGTEFFKTLAIFDEGAPSLMIAEMTGMNESELHAILGDEVLQRFLSIGDMLDGRETLQAPGADPGPHRQWIRFRSPHLRDHFLENGKSKLALGKMQGVLDVLRDVSAAQRVIAPFENIEERREAYVRLQSFRATNSYRISGAIEGVEKQKQTLIDFGEDLLGAGILPRLESLLDGILETTATGKPTELDIRLRLLRGRVFWKQGIYDQAREFFERAFEESRHIRNTFLLATCCRWLGTILRSRADEIDSPAEEALRVLEQAKEYLANMVVDSEDADLQSAVDEEEAEINLELGLLLRKNPLRRLKDARECIERALYYFEGVHDGFRISALNRYLAIIADDLRVVAVNTEERDFYIREMGRHLDASDRAPWDTDELALMKEEQAHNLYIWGYFHFRHGDIARSVQSHLNALLKFHSLFNRRHIVRTAMQAGAGYKNLANNHRAELLLRFAFHRAAPEWPERRQVEKHLEGYDVYASRSDEELGALFTEMLKDIPQWVRQLQALIPL